MMKALRIKKKIFTFDKIYKQTISLCFIRAVFLQIFTIILNFLVKELFQKNTIYRTKTAFCLLYKVAYVANKKHERNAK